LARLSIEIQEEEAKLGERLTNYLPANKDWRMNAPLDRLPEGWFVSDPETAREMEQELSRELPPRHLLDGTPVRVVAHRLGTDDVLCQHLADPSRFTVIHLTWSGVTESDSEHPWVEADGSFGDFLAYENRWLSK